MTIDIKDVEQVAQLARLQLTPEEKNLYALQLSQILEHAGKIATLDLSATQPTSHAVAVDNVLREDKVKPCLSPAEALKNAPVAEGAYFRVPKIV